MLAILFYDVVVAVHVMAIVIACGVTFAYPVLLPYVGRSQPTAVPTLHGAQERIGRVVIMPFATLALIAGIYLASDRDLWGEAWVIVPLIILIVLMVLGGAFFAPQARRMASLARRDLAAPSGEGPPFSAEYLQAVKQMRMVGMLGNLLILVAIFFMAAKPFA